jgi:OOP family OmpA-OmpF porin
MNNKKIIVSIATVVPILFTAYASAQSESENHPLYAPYHGWPPCAVMEANGETIPDGQVITWNICPSTPFVAAISDSDNDGVPDNIDQCPDTPAGVKVDAVGCPLDSDKDGVPDYLDRCPNTPSGVAVNSEGCPLDSDNDGVPDDLDKCPNTPSGVAVNSEGCPLDSDNDGVPDYLDKCPNTPPGVTVNEEGCPAPVVLKGVHFEFDSAKLTANARKILNKVADSLRNHPNLDITIAGHTDSLGSAEYNKRLSQLRAESVMNYLVASGIKQSRMKAVGYGEERPIASNATEEGRAQNRRVELQTSDNH